MGFLFLTERAICVGDQIPDLSEFCHRVGADHPHAGRQQNGVSHPVRQVPGTAKRIGERMHQMGAGMVDRRAAVPRGPEHLQLRRQILRLIYRTLDMAYQLV